jgi:hypothetical protein
MGVQQQLYVNIFKLKILISALFSFSIFQSRKTNSRNKMTSGYRHYCKWITQDSLYELNKGTEYTVQYRVSTLLRAPMNISAMVANLRTYFFRQLITQFIVQMVKLAITNRTTDDIKGLYKYCSNSYYISDEIVEFAYNKFQNDNTCIWNGQDFQRKNPNSPVYLPNPSPSSNRQTQTPCIMRPRTYSAHRDCTWAFCSFNKQCYDSDIKPRSQKRQKTRFIPTQISTVYCRPQFRKPVTPSRNSRLNISTQTPKTDLTLKTTNFETQASNSEILNSSITEKSIQELKTPVTFRKLTIGKMECCFAIMAFQFIMLSKVVYDIYMI